MDERTKLAFHRTFLAYERSRMAWVRTSLALISFGFGIAKFFQYLHESQGIDPLLLGPQTLGMVMIFVGLASLVAANIQQRRALVALRAEWPDMPHSIAGATATVIMVLGVLAFISALV